MMLFVLVFLFILCVHGAQPFPNIDYACFGYDLMKGNPQSFMTTNGIDPGWTISPIFNCTVYGGVTPDGRYSLPYGLTAVECSKCASLSKSEYAAISGDISYQQSLYKDVNVNMDDILWDVAFSASASFFQVYDATISAQNAFASLESVCCVYQTHLEIFDPPPLTRNFVNAVASMPLVYTGHESWFATFIDTFGTSYPIRLSFGGKYGYCFELTSAQWSLFESSTLDIQESATYSAMFLSGDSASMTSTQINQALFFQGYTSEQYKFEIPMGAYPANSSVDAWRQAVTVDPMPISIDELSSIVTLLTNFYFPNDTSIYAKSVALTNAYKDYCQFLLARKQVRSCVPIPDPPLPQPSIFGGMYTFDQCNKFSVANPYTHNLNCPVGYTPYDVGRTLTPGGCSGCNCGQNSFLCLLSGYHVDPLHIFGGMYQNCYSNGCSTNKGNPLTGGLNCPSGYTPIQRGYTKDPDDSSWAGEFSCCNTSVPLSLTQIGGFFQQPESYPSSCMVYNQYTNGFSCPAGFKAYPIAHVQTCGSGSNQNAWQYICLNNVF